MRKFTVTKHEFDHFLFPFTMNVAAESETEFETGVRLVQALRDPNRTEARELTSRQNEAEREGEKIYPQHELRRDQDTFIIEEDVWKLTVKRLGVNKTRINPLASEDYNEFLKKVEDAEKWDPPEEKKSSSKKSKKEDKKE